MLTMVLLLAVSATTCGELCQPDAIAHYGRLNTLASLTRYQSERAAFLVRRSDGGLTTVPWPAGEHAKASYTGHIPAHCVAIIHTHPRKAPRPSVHDVAQAKRLGLPIIVITPRSITVATPRGTTEQLFEEGWTRR
jgi:hypothetical protein